VKDGGKTNGQQAGRRQLKRLKRCELLPDKQVVNRLVYPVKLAENGLLNNRTTIETAVNIRQFVMAIG
jgi:hypothetical protein